MLTIADEVSTDMGGYIVFCGRTLTQSEAIDLALALTRAVQRSIDRNQVNQPSYYDSAAILARKETKLGKAISALGKVYG